MASSNLPRTTEQAVSRKKFLQGLAVAGTLGATSLALSGSAIRPVFANGIDIDGYTYIIDNELGTFKAYNGTTGGVEFSDSRADNVINYVLNKLSPYFPNQPGHGGSIFIREGTYPLWAGLKIEGSDIDFKMSKGAWLTLASGLTTDVITVKNRDDTVSGANNVTLEVNIDGTGAGTIGPPGPYPALIRIGSPISQTNYNVIIGQQCIVRNCNLQGPKYHGIYLEKASGVDFVYSNRIQTNGSPGSGIRMDGPCSDHHIFQNDIGGFGPSNPPNYPIPMDSGIFCNGCNEVTISGNQVYSNGVGIDVVDCDIIRILGNNLQGNYQEGIRVSSDGPRCRRIVLQGNVIFDNGLVPSTPDYSAGIHLGGSGPVTDISIVGNTCSDYKSPQTQNYGIRIDNSQVDTFIITDNMLWHNAIRGFALISFGPHYIITDNWRENNSSFWNP